MAVYLKDKDSTNDKPDSTVVSFFKKLQIKKTIVDEKFGFLFNVYNPKTDGMIFISTILIIPMISLLLFKFAFGMTPGSGLTVVNQGIWIVSALVGAFIIYRRDTRIFFGTGILTFYTFLLAPFCFLLVGSMFFLFTQDLMKSWWFPIYEMWTQIAAEIFVIWLAIKYTTDLKDRIISTFKKAWKILIPTVLIGSIFMVGFGIFLWVPIAKALGIGESENQNNLNQILNSNILGWITLFVLTVLVAPLAEELVARNAIFMGVGNRTIALFVSTFYFGMLHVQAGDIENILNYLIGGFILSAIFSISRGNVTYSWLVHAIYNFVALMIITFAN